MAKEIDLTLVAEERTEFGKGAARRIRRANKIPAVLHDHGSDPVHLTLPGHQVMLALKASGNSVFTVRTGSTSTLALPRQVQRDAIRGTVEHLDLDVIHRGERVTVAIPIHLQGEPAPETLLMHELTELEVQADPTALPDHIELLVEGFPAGTVVTAGEVELPAGLTLVTDPSAQVVAVGAQQSASAAAADLAAAEAEAGVVATEVEQGPAGEVESEGGSTGEDASAAASAVQQS